MPQLNGVPVNSGNWAFILKIIFISSIAGSGIIFLSSFNNKLFSSSVIIVSVGSINTKWYSFLQKLSKPFFIKLIFSTSKSSIFSFPFW